jgi:hypothetical protein
MTVPDTTALENGKTYTTTLPRTLPGDGDVNIVDKTTTKASFDKSKIIITSQADTWQSASQKTKTIVRYIYDGSFSYG